MNILVPAWTTMSAPSVSGWWKSGVAQELSTMIAMPLRLRHRRDRRQVLHLEGQRARALDEDRLGLVRDQLGDPGADPRIVEASSSTPNRVSVSRQKLRVGS